MKQSFRKLKARKAKFGFETTSFYKPEDILNVAEAMKVAKWMDVDAIFQYDINHSSCKFRIYTDFQPLADELERNFC